ncbi:hypothetical protein AGDE_14106 [Angomonas deanei]|uniref:Uncharacterized protein n=1 Tax=Angomonas deanei TaxID=59799 RepID=A0A7G2C1D8_9TRYP|nr:hypothetical protein AGDE_14106 [Angomonas deanei]CAD2213479.1 hypothetical protein, conserved [Angomonas deanei]|eukprot:EPY21413.1 hypothetical protein AGDE_14106 [Angomonas deanei]
MPRFVRVTHARSRSLIEKTPVNEADAVRDRANTVSRTTELLTVYRKIKHNTQQRIRRIFYDRWRSLRLRHKCVAESGTQTVDVSTRECMTATENDWMEGSIPVLSRSPSDNEEEREEIYVPSAKRVAPSGVPPLSHSGPKEDAPVECEDPFISAQTVDYPRIPPQDTGIAAVSRPASSISNVKKSDRPPRKTVKTGVSIDTQLPAVVVSPIRVKHLR